MTLTDFLYGKIRDIYQNALAAGADREDLNRELLRRIELLSSKDETDCEA